MMTGWMVILAVVLMVLGGASAQTTLPATQSASSISEWLGGLADGDDAVREQARSKLLGISRDQLPELREAVQQALPLERSQMAALKEIVIHVYLTGETFETIPEQGFIGIRSAPQNLRPPVMEGVLIQDGELLMGFCGYGSLQTGDVIVKVAEYPEKPIRSTIDLSDAIKRDAGRTVHLDVLRRGQVVRVSIKLNGRPALAGQGEAVLNELLHERLVKAEEYWQRVFAPLLEEGVS
jgi:hypothetical protein